MKRILACILMVSMLLMSGCIQRSEPAVTAQPKELTLSAAASLKEALTELQPLLEKEKNIRLIVNFGASGTLQKQIEEGAPVDVFLSAGKKQMDELEDKGLIKKGSRRDLLGNRLVLIIPIEFEGKINTMADLVNLNVKMSIGQPDTVPAGQYAKESLTYLKLWDRLEDKIVYAKDVKQVVTYVESGEAAAGVVYRSDAIGLKNSLVVEELDEKLHKPIVYPAAIIAASQDKGTAAVFLDFLDSKPSGEIFKKHGFDIVQ